MSADQAYEPGMPGPSWTLGDVAALSGGGLRFSPANGADAARFGWPGIRLDSRAVEPGDFFVALRGERHDAHDFLADVRDRGALGALVDRPLAGLPQVVVADSLAGWQRWGAEHRRRHPDLPLIAISGSSGKTTVKDQLAHLLAGIGAVHATGGNRNNQVGVPWTLLGIAPGHRFAIVEMGMNHPGEIAVLSRLAAPTAALLTAIGSAHIGFLGSREAILSAKLEILEGCPGGAPLVLPHDPWVLERLPEKVRRRRLTTFGFDPAADWHPAGPIEWSLTGTRFSVSGLGPVTTPLLGPGGVLSALAALAGADCLGCDAAALAPRLASAPRHPLRMEPRSIGGVEWLLDCYNASPESARLAMQFLEDVPHAGRRILVLGELGELGDFSAEIHRGLGLASRPIETVLFVGEGAKEALAAHRGGAASSPSSSVAAWTPTAEDAAEWLRPRLRPGDLVLLKGARKVGLERILERLHPEGSGDQIRPGPGGR